MAFAATKRKRIGGRRKPVEQLKLTSMIDMFTILLVYLLKSYSPTQSPTFEETLKLPASISTKIPQETTIIQIAVDMIIIDGDPVIMVEKKDGIKLYPLVRDGATGKPKKNENGKFIASSKPIPQKMDAKSGKSTIALPGLLELLKLKKKLYEGQAADKGLPFKGEVTIMCDKTMPYEILKRVMATAGEAGFGEFKFAAYRGDQG